MRYPCSLYAKEVGFLQPIEGLGLSIDHPFLCVLTFLYILRFYFLKIIVLNTLEQAVRQAHRDIC